MDKKGNANYLRLPLALEAVVEELAHAEGRTKNEMIVHLLSLGVHIKKFKIESYCSTNFFDLEGHNCKEK